MSFKNVLILIGVLAFYKLYKYCQRLENELFEAHLESKDAERFKAPDD